MSTVTATKWHRPADCSTCELRPPETHGLRLLTGASQARRVCSLMPSEETPPGVEVRHTLEVVGEVRRSQAVEAAADECVLKAPGASCTPAHFSDNRRFSQSRPGWFPERSKHLWPGCSPHHFHRKWNLKTGAVWHWTLPSCRLVPAIWTVSYQRSIADGLKTSISLIQSLRRCNLVSTNDALSWK